MKWVTAGVTFVNLSVVCGLLLGLAGRGLNTVSAALALVCGAAFAVRLFWGLATVRLDRDPLMPRQQNKKVVRIRPMEPNTALEPTADSAVSLARGAGFGMRQFDRGSAFGR